MTLELQIQCHKHYTTRILYTVWHVCVSMQVAMAVHMAVTVAVMAVTATAAVAMVTVVDMGVEMVMVGAIAAMTVGTVGMTDMTDTAAVAVVDMDVAKLTCQCSHPVRCVWGQLCFCKEVFISKTSPR